MRRPRSRRLLYAGVGLALAVALLSSLRFWPASAPATPSDVAHAPAPASIAVLPFADLSPSKDMEYFADGIAEELMSSLSKVGGLDVIGRRSSFVFKGKGDDAQSIGEKLRVATILEGSVRKEGDRIRITAQLTRTKDGVSLWAETYDRKFDDVLDIQGSIAREVVTALAPLMQLYQEAGAARRSRRSSHARRGGLPRLPARRVPVHALDRPWTRSRREPSSCAPWNWTRSSPRHTPCWRVRTSCRRMLAIGDVAQSKSLASAALDKAMKLDPTIGDLWWVRLMFVAGDDAPSRSWRVTWNVRSRQTRPKPNPCSGSPTLT